MANEVKSTKPAKAAKTENAQEATPIVVAGHGTSKDGDVFVIFKNKVSANPLFKAQGVTHTGTRYLAKGITLEQAQEALPRGAKVPGAQWGEQVTEVEYDGVFKVIFEGE
jgi:hypothetical protein